MRAIVFVLFPVFIIACSTGEDIKTIIINEFPKNEAIIGEHVDFYPIPFCPGNIFIIDSLLLKINSNRCEDNFFYVYNKNNSEFLGSFGTKGRGPNEFLYPHTTGQYIIDNVSIKLWVHDIHQKRFDLIDVTKSIDEKRTVISDSFREPLPMIFVINAIILPNGDLIGRSMSPEGRFFYHDSKNELTKWVEYFPEVAKPPFSENDMFNLYSGPTGIKHDNSRIASALQFFKRIDVFSARLEHLFSLAFNDSPGNPEFFSNPENPMPGTLMRYYSDLYLSSRYIYALNRNVPQEKIRTRTYPATNELHVFSWDGDPVACYSLNQTLYSFTIDEENGFLFGLTRATGDELESQVVRFKL